MKRVREEFVSDDLLEICDVPTSSNNANFTYSSDRSVSSNDIDQIATSSSVNTKTFPLPMIADNSIKDFQWKQKKNSYPRCNCLSYIRFTWDPHNKSENVQILNDSMEVRFNSKCSNGTAVVRCTEPMSKHQYYWEMQMNYPVYGTDIMVGVGTPEATIAYLPDRYVSRLGMDEQTWGFSCHGMFHHNGERRLYAQRFDQGNVIGVHLDLWKGTLSFYKNRKCLGVACSGLKDKTLYAMASSTAACSGMRMIHACCFPSSLQFLCASKLREVIPDNKNVLDVIDMPPGLKQFLQHNLSWLLGKSHLNDDLKAWCMVHNISNNFKGIVSINDGTYVGVSPRRNILTRELFVERSAKRSRTFHSALGSSDYDSD